MLENLLSYATDYRADEQQYLMMRVEKGDLLSLFKPISDEYTVPIVSSKAWAPILLRSHIATLSKRAEANGLTRSCYYSTTTTQSARRSQIPSGRTLRIAGEEQPRAQTSSRLRGSASIRTISTSTT
jgi:hypothetical protein